MTTEAVNEWQAEEAERKKKDEDRWQKLRDEEAAKIGVDLARQATYDADAKHIMMCREKQNDLHGQYIGAVNRLAAALEECARNL